MDEPSQRTISKLGLIIKINLNFLKEYKDVIIPHFTSCAINDANYAFAIFKILIELRVISCYFFV